MFQYLLYKPINYSHLLNILIHVLKGWKLYREFVHSTPIVKKKQSSHIQTNSVTLKGLNVLLVDDEYFSRTAIIRLLQRGEMNAVAFTDGHKALESLGAAHYDVAIFDYQMPKIDGITLIAKVREHEKSAGKTPMPIMRSFCAYASVVGRQQQGTGGKR